MIRASKWPISDETISQGIANMHWPCRYEFVRPNILVDGAHNPGGMRALISAIQSDGLKPEVLWVGMTEGHNGEEMARLWTEAFPNARVMPGQSKSPRALSVKQVAGFFPSPPAGQGEGLTVVTGSLYWAGQVRARYVEMPVDHRFGSY
jgi:dihydrofolate synthase/folylpolyglutamate synthase